MRKVVKNDSEIKIKYYENIKMIESFEYLGKKSWKKLKKIIL